MDQNSKRERATNFNSSEVRLLTELVAKHRSVIENKKTDAVTNKEKDDAWNKITNSFDSTTSEASVRTPKTLKLKYEGIKKLTKKKIPHLHRQEIYRTGGGPCSAPDITDVEEKVLAICSNFSGLDPRNDSDNITEFNLHLDVQPVQPVECPIVVPIHSVNIININDDMVEYKTTDVNFIQASQLDESFLLNTINDEIDIKDSHNKWSTWNSLKSKVSHVLKTNKASVTAKLDQLSAARLELVKLQIENARKEHAFVEEEQNKND